MAFHELRTVTTSICRIPVQHLWLVLSHRRTSTAKVLQHAAAHNARHQRDPDSQCLFASVPKVRESLIVKSGDFRAEFDEGGGLKNRYTCERKSWIRQVLISRTLSVCGEVAERLKAAVC